MDYEPSTSELDESQQIPNAYFERFERRLNYNQKFAIRLTRRERAAPRVRVTVRTLQSASQYSNRMYNPWVGAYWRYTAHDGDTGVKRKGTIDFVEEVIYDFVNESLISSWMDMLSSHLTQSTMLTITASMMNAIATIPIPGFQLVIPAYNAALIEFMTIQRDRWVNANLATAMEELPDGFISQPVLRLPFFQSSESLWKFVSINDGGVAEIVVEHWRLPQEFVDFFEIEQPDSTGEEEPQGDTDNSDLNPPPQPTPENPPPPQDEVDPRNDPDDYADAPDPGEEYPPGTLWRCSGEGGLNADPDNGLVCRGNGVTYVDIVESTFRPYFVTEPNRYLSPDRGCTLQRVITSNGPASTQSGGQIGYFRNAQVEGPL